ncbi:MAG TPA: IPT/TIG domain-containing protein, partial [Holophaga sp.]|nr:IPT/TIG domain-containing protein [Holophaga sp.]
DQTERFTASGQTRTVIGTLADASKPFRVTLAWTDAPGTTSSAPWVNNLDLTVTVGGTTYQGNVFSGAYSTTGGSADIRNNVESVFLPAGVTGTFQVTITAINIAGDGVPNNEDVVDQDYALVVYNATEAPVPVIAVSASQLTSESSTPANSMPDPGEAVTYQFTFKNTGAAAANALTISLADTGGVTAASSALPLGTLAVQGSATGTFSFTVDPSKAVGSALPLTFTVKDGTTDLGTMTHTLTTGYFSPSITSFKPAPGSQGIIVTITGTHFTGTTAVKFNGMLAKTVTVASDAQITATAPSGFTTGPITVTTPGGTATSADSLKGLDLDGKGSVDVADMAVLAKAFGSSSGSPVYEDAADLDNDLKVGDSDLKLWLAGF